jgi:ring-1,2-phenylacetyl-CoA epoxidase subunit PaaD
MPTTDRETILETLRAVKDPEVPVLDVIELGVLRDVIVHHDEHDADNPHGRVEVIITPTYSGCPAMNTLQRHIEQVLSDNGHTDATVTTRMSPAWTTDWMTDEARQKLKDYGIAPPQPARQPADRIPCPWCDSPDTGLRSEFGSTSCKSLHFCNSCMQPFEHFKCI